MSVVWAATPSPSGAAPQAARDPCARPPAGSLVSDPAELRSSDGILSVELAVRNHREDDGSIRYCYVTPAGEQSPTLRMRPGDLLVLKLKNELSDLGAAPAAGAAVGAASGAEATSRTHAHDKSAAEQDPCTGGSMSITSTNLHFHGLTVPPICHEDEVLRTSIPAGAPPFEYRFRIPAYQPPGLYWYHPHIHGFTTPQVLGGASGALIIEGIERANPALAGMAQRVLVIRDQNLLHPDAPPSKSEPVAPKMLIDRDGDAANNGTGFGMPAKDLSINYVPVPYPDYPPAAIEMRPG